LLYLGNPLITYAGEGAEGLEVRNLSQEEKGKKKKLLYQIRGLFLHLKKVLTSERYPSESEKRKDLHRKEIQEVGFSFLIVRGAWD